MEREEENTRRELENSTTNTSRVLRGERSS